MSCINKSHCPLSEDFFYWPPEEIVRYTHWYEVESSPNKRHKKTNKGKKTQNLNFSR